MNKKAFIFDLDGVLIHTDRFHYLAWKAIADKLKIPFDEAINNRLRGVSRMESLEIILEAYQGVPLTDTQKLALAEEKNDLYRQMLQTMSPKEVSDDVFTTLQALKDRGYLLAVGSSSKNAKFILEKTGLDKFFDTVSDGTNITRSKPDPEVFLKAAEFLGISPANCIVVEDAASGIDAAKAAGMRAVGIGDAYWCEKTNYPIKHLSDLLTDVRCKGGSTRFILPPINKPCWKKN